MKQRLTKIFLFLICANISFAQVPAIDSVTIAPGPEYKAGWMHRLLFGDHWRDLWITPFTVPVLDLHKFAGGLKPYEVGGGQQTRSLKFYGNDGQRWKFRSINKSTAKLLPEELHDTFVQDILQDQISSANPFSAVIVSELLQAVDVLQAKPQIVVLPDDPVLGEFRNEFAGMLGTIEVHPDEVGDSNDVIFFDTEKIKGTYKLFETIEEKRNDKVFAEGFLKVRLMDVLMGDWDRHADQWRWAKVEEDFWDYWIPIPRDRDQAFAKFDGIFPRMAEYVIPQITTFDYDYPQIEDLTWNGRHIDRKFLTELSKSKWDSIAVFIQNSITDKVIEHAVRRLPREQFKISGKELISKLKYRRDHLTDVVDEYYDLVNYVADVYGTQKDDYVLVERLNDEQTSVTIYELDKSGLAPEGRAYFHKVFNDSVTNEIRIYMLDDDDYCLVTGKVDSGPMIRVIGGSGRDIFADNSEVKGYFLSITPFEDAENKTIFYDQGDNTIYRLGEGTSINTEKRKEPTDVFDKYEPTQIDRGVNWVALPDAGYSTTDGVQLGGNLSLYSYNFRKEPYEYLQRLSFLYAFLPKSYNIEYFGEFIDIFSDIDILLDIKKNELNFTNYFGFGNENPFNRTLYHNNYYRLEQEHVLVNPRLRFNLSSTTSLEFGLFYEYNESKLAHPQLINSFHYSDYGIGVLETLGLNTSLVYDTRDNELYPQEGTYFEVEGKYYNEALDSKDDYLRGKYDLRHYFTFDFPERTTLVLRSSGGKLWGRYPFYNAVFIGGENDLRAYSRGRFSGDAAVSFQGELRTKIMSNKIFFKGDMGIHAFTETGRVFTANQTSKKWHPSIGGGLWSSFFNRKLVFSFTYAYSADEQNIYLDTKMAF